MSRLEKLTANLEAPKNKEGFTNEWARRIIVEYTKKTDPDWLLANVLKVHNVTVKDNPHPGMLSDSYVLDVLYCQSGEPKDQTVETWFVKIPKSLSTALLDEMEIFMYEKMFPLLQAFSSKATVNESEVQLPIPLVFHCAFDENKPSKNILVMENLRDQGYKPLRPETCGLVFMRAAMTSLAIIHASAFAYETALGGRSSFLSRFPLIKEDNMPKASLMRSQASIEDLLEPYLDYMGKVAPDIGPQIAFLKKFHKFLLGIFHNLQKDKELWKLKVMVHGDSKIDNFMFKKNPWAVDDEYNALIIDWQGVAYDLLSGDLMWTLYGFMKNLPDKNSTVDTFIDYSINFYHQELMRLLELMHVDMSKLNLPTDEYDATVLIRKGFLYDFLKTVLFKPLLRLTIKGGQVIHNWFHNQGTVALPDEKDVFKSGTNFVNYIHLQITIATEVGTFHDLAPLCIQAMKDAIFGIYNNLEDSDNEETIEDVLSQAAAILKEHDNKSEETKIVVNGDCVSTSELVNKEPTPEKKVSVTETLESDGETVRGTVVIKKKDGQPETAEANKDLIKIPAEPEPNIETQQQPQVVTAEPVVSVEQDPQPSVIASQLPTNEEPPLAAVAPSIAPPPLPEPESTAPPATTSTGTKKKRKKVKKAKKKNEPLVTDFQTKIQELSQSLCNTRAATSQLLDLRTKHQEELSDDPELKEAVDNLLKQVANFHRTCIEQLEK